MMKLIRHPKFDEFFASISDQKVVGAVTARIDRLRLGNPGDHKSVGGGVHELRIDIGPGWRVYYAQVGQRIVLLLGGGTKKKQGADIAAAIARLDELKRD